VAQITYQSLFKLYPKLSGMTGTAKTEVITFYSLNIRILLKFKQLLVILPRFVMSIYIYYTLTLLQEKEFLKMFQMPVIEVPTNMTNIRNDLPIQAFAVRCQVDFFLRKYSLLYRR
jgi:preprotein translocase subunit SecA